VLISDVVQALPTRRGQTLFGAFQAYEALGSARRKASTRN
jgi:hypothetical protein